MPLMMYFCKQPLCMGTLNLCCACCALHDSCHTLNNILCHDTERTDTVLLGLHMYVGQPVLLSKHSCMAVSIVTFSSQHCHAWLSAQLAIASSMVGMSSADSWYSDWRCSSGGQVPGLRYDHRACKGSPHPRLCSCQSSCQGFR